MTIDVIVGTSIIDLVFIGPADLPLFHRFPEGDHRLTDLVAAAEPRCAEHRITLGTTATRRNCRVVCATSSSWTPT